MMEPSEVLLQVASDLHVGTSVGWLSVQMKRSFPICCK